MRVFVVILMVLMSARIAGAIAMVMQYLPMCVPIVLVFEHLPHTQCPASSSSPLSPSPPLSLAIFLGARPPGLFYDVA